MSSKPRKTVFLDRDGVINRRLPGDYVTRLEDFHLLDGAIEAIVLLNRQGYRTVVVTNQRGVALGRMKREQVDHLHETLSGWVDDAGGMLHEFYVCPHDRDIGCGCRKPQPGLLEQAHRFQPVAWEASWLIGDSDTDILAGLKKGVTTIKIGPKSLVNAHFHCRDLRAAARLVVG